MSSANVLTRLWLVVILATAVLAQDGGLQPRPAPSTAPAASTSDPRDQADSSGEPQLTPVSLLDRSHALAALLAPDDRAYLLGSLVAAASQFRLPAAKNWSEELLALSPELTPGSPPREYAQATSVLWMSRSDGNRALDMLEAMDAPSAPLSQLGAVLRNNAIRTVFQQQLAAKGTNAIPDLRQLARRMGDSGQYPYSALLPLLSRRESDPELTLAIFSEALEYYRRSSPAAANENDYGMFVRTMWRRVPQAQAHEAAEEIARHLAILSDLAQNEKLQYTSTSASSASNSSTQASLPAQRAASQQLSLLRQIDPELADAVVEAHPSLNDTSNVPSAGYFMSAPASPSNGPPAASPQLDARTRRMARTNPENAIKAASAIQDPRSQATALAEIVPTLSNSDSQRAQAVLGQVQQAVNKIDDSSGKLAAINSLARAASAVNDQSTLRDAIQQGFALMQDVMRQQNEDHPENRHSSARTGYGFGELVRYGMGVAPEFTLTQINGLADDETKAFLLVSAAQGLQRSQRQAPARRLASGTPGGPVGAVGRSRSLKDSRTGDAQPAPHGSSAQPPMPTTPALPPKQ